MTPEETARERARDRFYGLFDFSAARMEQIGALTRTGGTAVIDESRAGDRHRHQLDEYRRLVETGVERGYLDPATHRRPAAGPQARRRFRRG